MPTSLERLNNWLGVHSENEHLEFKEAKNSYDFEKLAKYCAALANEGGGKIILGIADKTPRQVVGSRAFENLDRTKAGLIQRLSLRIEAEELDHPGGRIVVFHVPSRPIGQAISYKGAYWMRGGDTLVPMTQDMLKRIFDETGPDLSAKINPNASIAELDPKAIQRFRKMWRRKSRNEALDSVSDEQLLSDAELLDDGKVTYAALILLGTGKALGRHLPQAEVIFEYRASETSLPAQQRVEFREGFFLLGVSP